LHGQKKDNEFKAMSTVRFSDLVKRHGQPEVKSLWTKPEEDAAFMRAVKQGRILTLSQEPNSKSKDSGEIGFHQKPHASYLIFPKRLEASQGVKVVGIKYDLIREPEIRGALSAKTLKTLPRKKRTPTREKPKKPSTFNVRVRRMATVELTISVEAKTKSEARHRAVQIAEDQSFDSAKAAIKTEALR
jgi:hypothetical protein